MTIDIDTMTFTHDHTAIQNPTCSDCGRFVVSPKEYGFEIWGTGGGCSAWVKKVDDGYIVLTSDYLSHDLGGALSPFEMGFYDGSDDETWGNLMGIRDLLVGVVPD